MKRRKFLNRMGIGFGALATGQVLLASPGQTPWKISMLTRDIGVFTEKGGTILFYLSTAGIVVVDAQFPEQAAHLIGELQKKTRLSFNQLINTHHHGDHTAGNIAFKGLVYQVVAHKNSLENQRRVAQQQGTNDKQLYPDLIYSDTMTREVGKENILLHYFGPAHTNGDSLIHLEKANIVHMGDLINNRRHPYVDRTAGASLEGWITVLDKTTSTFDKKTTYVFGHASEGFPVYGKKADIDITKDYFEKLLKFAASAIRSGQSKEEFIASKVIPGVTQWVGPGIERPLTAAYEELSEGRGG